MSRHGRESTLTVANCQNSRVLQLLLILLLSAAPTAAVPAAAAPPIPPAAPPGAAPAAAPVPLHCVQLPAVPLHCVQLNLFLNSCIHIPHAPPPAAAPAAATAPVALTVSNSLYSVTRANTSSFQPILNIAASSSFLGPSKDALSLRLLR